MKVGIIGAGTMGSGIAQAFAEAGNTVYLCDINEEFAANGKSKIAKGLSKLVAKEKVTQDLAEDMIVPVNEPDDPWMRSKTVYLLPDGFEGTEPVYFAINGIGRYVRPGRPETVPEPIARLVDQRNKAMQSRQRYYQELREETAKNQLYLRE